jgi:hypothetical protein
LSLVHILASRLVACFACGMASFDDCQAFMGFKCDITDMFIRLSESITTVREAPVARVAQWDVRNFSNPFAPFCPDINQVPSCL